MIITVLIVAIALYWLAIETKYLTIRLKIPLIPFLQMVMGTIGMIVSVALFGGLDDEIKYLPSYYRRYIQRVRKSSDDKLWLPPESFHPVLINEMRQTVVIALRKGVKYG